jgi:hypothetical protein
MPPVFRKDLYYEKTGYTPHEGQKILHYTPSRFKVVPCGRRYGKTIWGGKEIEPCAFVPSRGINGGPQLGWIIGPQYVHAEKEFAVVYDSLRKLGIDRDSIKFQKNADSGALHIVTSWGFELIGKSAGKPETLVGDGLDFALMVEAGLHKRNTWGQYIRPTLSDKRGWAAFTGVPEGKSMHSLLYALSERGKDPTKKQWMTFHAPSWENNLVFPGGRQDDEILEAEDDLTEDEFNRQYGAQFVDKVGVVMQEYDNDYHTYDLNYNPKWPLYAAIDYGFTNYWVWLWIQVDEWDNVYVIRERLWKMTDTLDICIDLSNDPIDGPLSRACVAFYPDPAEPEDALLIEKQLKIKQRGNTGGERRIRDSLIRRALKPRNAKIFGQIPRHPEDHAQLRINRQCTNLRWECREGYRWPEHKSEVHSDSENPLDKDNHSIEALGRFMRGYFGLPSEHGKRQTSRVTKTRMG